VSDQPTKAGHGLLPRCIGFGEFDNRRKDGPGCSNPADANAALLWCKRCEALRLKHITEQFARISEGFA